MKASFLDDIYVCPACRCSVLDAAADGGTVSCAGCGRSFDAYGGAVDFVSAEGKENGEREFYQDVYGRKREKGYFLKTNEMKNRWTSRLFPEREEVLRRMGEISGRTVLCLGNGDKDKELYFSLLGARVIISDISIASVLAVKDKHGDDFRDVAFHAIDAYRIPLRDNSVDVVYGWQMTHHLEDLPAFLREIRRVMTRGSVAVFVDNAYSPGWHKVKWGLLGPFMAFVHRKKGVSPRDLYLSRTGDYREEYLAGLVAGEAFSDFRARRMNLLSYEFSKGVRDVFGIAEITRKNAVCYPVARMFSGCDEFLAGRFDFYRNNLRNMVWSFRKIN